MTKITKLEASTLKSFGFKWHKDGTTDRVEAKEIKEIIPTLLGFLVIYSEEAALIYSRAIIESIDWPENIEKQWILVNWEKIEDGPKS